MKRKKFCLFSLAISSFFLLPLIVQAQGLLGNPGFIEGGSAKFRLEVGGGTVLKQKIKYKETTIPFNTTSQNFLITGEEGTDEIEKEQFFLSGFIGLGSMGDFFANVGMLKIKNDAFDGDQNLSWGAGLRISPPQDGWVRFGLIVQVAHEKSTDDNVTLQFSSFDTEPTNPTTITSIRATAKGKSEIEITRYDIFLGFSAQNLPILPYGGLLVTVLDGTDTITSNGQAFIDRFPRSGGLVTTTTENFSTSFENDLEEESMVGGVLGFVFNPSGKSGVTLEGQFGSNSAVMLAVFMRFS